ncbi:MAG TPA: hypothetical protein VF171_09400, partial [Trueperaceae bacterium]
MKRAPAQLDARPDALLLPDLVRALIERLGDGDLSCELCDRQLATAAAPSWPLRPSQFGFVGPAHTVEAASGDVAAVRRAALALAPGEVLVVAAAQARGAVFGETLARAAQAS